jgi:DNA-binding transcriptional ArsR family regulator
MDEVFKVLADPTRRLLLDELFKTGGQSLSTLEARLPMSRFGVMKHLRLLEAAGLVVTRRHGREKLHFLNPAPIRFIHDRWISKYAEPWSSALAGLKQIFQIYIQTTPDRLWRAITDPEMRREYTFGCRYEGTGWRRPIFEGENLLVDPPSRLVQSIRALWVEDVRTERTSRVTWEIEAADDSCRLTVTHDQLQEGAHAELYGGWPMVLSGLKTLLEAGETLTSPVAPRFARNSGG